MMMEVIVGTYEEFLIGYLLEERSSEEINKDFKKWQFTQSFSNHAHCGSIRSIACGEQILASGSTDETVKLFDLRTRAELGTLMEHSGTISCLAVCGKSHIVSGGEDGKVCVWRRVSWQLEKTLLGHSEAVTSIAIHPSCRLAMTTSRDATVRTWNLIKGRPAYTTNTKTGCEEVVWSPDGSKYAVVIADRMDIYDVSTAGIIHCIRFSHRLNHVIFLTDTCVALCGESSDILVSSLTCNTSEWIRNLHQHRIKAITSFRRSVDLVWLLTASSDGFIKLLQLQVKDEKVIGIHTVLAEVDTCCRITCLTVHNCQAVVEESKDKEELGDRSSDETGGGTRVDIKRKNLLSVNEETKYGKNYVTVSNLTHSPLHSRSLEEEAKGMSKKRNAADSEDTHLRVKKRKKGKNKNK